MLALCSCSEEGENISTEDNLIEITFATDWKAQAEQGGFYQALAAGLYEKNGLKVKIIQQHWKYFKIKKDIKEQMLLL